jgi:hypothetical protein
MLAVTVLLPQVTVTFADEIVKSGSNRILGPPGAGLQDHADPGSGLPSRRGCRCREEQSDQHGMT